MATNILNTIDFQLQHFNNLIKKDLDNALVTFDYFVDEGSTKIFDWASLRNFLTFNKLEKTNYLKDIRSRAEEFIAYFNKVDSSMIKKLDEKFIFNGIGGWKGYTSDDFKLILLRAEVIYSLPNYSEEDRHFALQNHKFKKYSIGDFADSISKILDVILDIYPEFDENPSRDNDSQDVFKDNAFEIFSKWMQSPIDANRMDQKISFIFQQLKKENKLRVNSFKSTYDWAIRNNFINVKDKSVQKLFDSGCWISPNKILTKSRITFYNSLLLN